MLYLYVCKWVALVVHSSADNGTPQFDGLGVPMEKRAYVLAVKKWVIPPQVVMSLLNKYPYWTSRSLFDRSSKPKITVVFINTKLLRILWGGRTGRRVRLFAIQYRSQKFPVVRSLGPVKYRIGARVVALWASQCWATSKSQSVPAASREK